MEHSVACHFVVFSVNMVFMDRLVGETIWIGGRVAFL